MKTAKVVTGTEKSRGSSMMMSKGTVHAELKRKDDASIIGKTPINFESLEISPCPINRVDKNIYIGNYIGAQTIEYLKNNGITHIINTAIELPNYFEGQFKYVNLKLLDSHIPGEESLFTVLEPTYQKIVQIITTNPESKIFVHCAAGISRSASIVIYYMMKKYSMNFESALSNLRKVRNIVNPNDIYQNQLKDAQLQIETEKGIVL
jgi:predicted protein tyrosine phosphatase